MSGLQQGRRRASLGRKAYAGGAHEPQADRRRENRFPPRNAPCPGGRGLQGDDTGRWLRGRGRGSAGAGRLGGQRLLCSAHGVDHCGQPYAAPGAAHRFDPRGPDYRGRLGDGDHRQGHRCGRDRHGCLSSPRSGRTVGGLQGLLQWPGHALRRQRARLARGRLDCRKRVQGRGAVQRHRSRGRHHRGQGPGWSRRRLDGQRHQGRPVVHREQGQVQHPGHQHVPGGRRQPEGEGRPGGPGGQQGPGGRYRPGHRRWQLGPRPADHRHPGHRQGRPDRRRLR